MPDLPDPTPVPLFASDALDLFGNPDGTVDIVAPDQSVVTLPVDAVLAVADFCDSVEPAGSSGDDWLVTTADIVDLVTEAFDRGLIRGAAAGR